MSIQFKPVSANHHEGNAIVEKATRSIREYVTKLALADPPKSLVDLVSAATFYKNTARGHKKAVCFKLLYNRVRKLSTICNPQQQGGVTETLRKDAAVGYKLRYLLKVKTAHP